jgi:hypothetical protein
MFLPFINHIHTIVDYKPNDMPKQLAIERQSFLRLTGKQFKNFLNNSDPQD